MWAGYWARCTCRLDARLHIQLGVANICARASQSCSLARALCMHWRVDTNDSWTEKW